MVSEDRLDFEPDPDVTFLCYHFAGISTKIAPEVKFIKPEFCDDDEDLANSTARVKKEGPDAKPWREPSVSMETVQSNSTITISSGDGSDSYDFKLDEIEEDEQYIREKMAKVKEASRSSTHSPRVRSTVVVKNNQRNNREPSSSYESVKTLSKQNSKDKGETNKSRSKLTSDIPSKKTEVNNKKISDKIVDALRRLFPLLKKWEEIVRLCLVGEDQDTLDSFQRAASKSPKKLVHKIAKLVQQDQKYRSRSDSSAVNDLLENMIRWKNYAGCYESSHDGRERERGTRSRSHRSPSRNRDRHRTDRKSKSPSRNRDRHRTDRRSKSPRRSNRMSTENYPQFAIQKWTSETGDLSLRKLKNVAVGKVANPLGCTYDNELGFLFTGPTSILVCSEKGTLQGSPLVDGLVRPTALAVLKHGELIVILDGGSGMLLLYEVLTKKLKPFADHLCKARGVACTEAGLVVTTFLDMRRNNYFIRMYNPNSMNNFVSEIPFPSNVNNRPRGAKSTVIPCFMSSAGNVIYITDLGWNQLVCVNADHRQLCVDYVRALGLQKPGGLQFRYISGIQADGRYEILMADADSRLLMALSSRGDIPKIVKVVDGDFPYCSSFAVSPRGYLLACCRKNIDMSLFKFIKDGEKEDDTTKDMVEDLLAVVL